MCFNLYVVGEFRRPSLRISSNNDKILFTKNFTGIFDFEKSSGTGNYWKFQIVLVTTSLYVVRKVLAPSQLVDNLNWKSQPS